MLQSLGCPPYILHTRNAWLCRHASASGLSSILSLPDNSNLLASVHHPDANEGMGQPLDQVMGPIRSEAAAFVTMHSPDSQDLLPGLCLLTEKWLYRVRSHLCVSGILPAFAPAVLQSVHTSRLVALQQWD